MIFVGEFANLAEVFAGSNWKMSRALLIAVAGAKTLRLPVTLGCVPGSELRSSSQKRGGKCYLGASVTWRMIHQRFPS